MPDRPVRFRSKGFEREVVLLVCPTLVQRR